MISILAVDISDIAIAIAHAFRWLFALIAELIYNLIIVAYNLFEYLARAQILRSDMVQEIYRKVGFLLGLFMLFKLIFSLIQALVDPSKLTDKKSGYSSILVRCIISVILLGVTPAIFREAFQIQTFLIGGIDNSDNVIYKLIVGDTNVDSSSFGRVVATELYFSFYRDDERPFLSNAVDTTIGDVQFYENKVDEIKDKIRSGQPDANGNVEWFGYAAPYLNQKSDNGVYVVEFNELLSVVVGGFVLWMLIMYCFQIAARVFQLAYLQLIAPIPILSYISDPDGSFKKWIQQCVSTYLDLFVRLAIIYFVVYFASYVVELFENKNEILMTSMGVNQNDIIMITYIEVALLVGLLIFAKKVPDLIKDVFPSLGGAGKFSFGLKPPKEASAVFGIGAGALAGGVAGAATGLKYGEGLRGKLAGMTGGMFRGAFSARPNGHIVANAKKGIENVRNANMRAYQRHHDGSTFFGRMAPIHASRVADSFERELELYNEYDSMSQVIEKELEKNASLQRVINKKKELLERTKRGGPAPTSYEIRAADEAIARMKKTALAQELGKIKSGASDANAKLEAALKSAESIRKKGVDHGYAGFGTINIMSDSNEFFSNKKSTTAEVNSIKYVGGKRNKEYVEAKANAKYQKGQGGNH